MAKVKPIKSPKQFHTSNDKTGHGTSYGAGIRQPIGKIRDVMGSGKINMSKLGKPPKSLA